MVSCLNRDGLNEIDDLKRDPQERRNIAPDQAELGRRLAGLVRARMLEGKWLR